MANPQLKRVRFICHEPDGQVIRSGWGLWREYEIAEILDIQRKAGRRVEVEESEAVPPRSLVAVGVDFPAWLGTDVEFFDEFTVLDAV